MACSFFCKNLIKREQVMVENNLKLDFCDVLVVPKPTYVSSRKEVCLSCSYVLPKSKLKIKGVPIFAANMDGVGTLGMCETLAKSEMFTCLTKSNTIKIIENNSHESLESCKNFCIGTFGLDNESKNILENYDIENIFNIICLDVANGYMDCFAKFVESTRKRFPKIGIIAGNVVTPDGVAIISDAGADIVKIGIGSGSVCTTRRVAGVGYPQLSAILDCLDSCVDYDVLMMSDGGCVHPGDIGKAFAAGANFVMLGGMLAGYEEGLDGGTVFDDGEKKRFIFSGSSSSRALSKNNSSNNYRTSEGRVVVMDLKGSVSDAVVHILGGLRSTCSYTNSFDLKSLSYNCSFIRVNRQLNEYFEHHTIGS